MDEIQLTQELVRIKSENPPGNEKDIGLYIKDYLEDLKLNVELMTFEGKRANVVAYCRKEGGLMLQGHLDTVPGGSLDNWEHNPFEAKVVNGKIYGRGTSDCKGNIAAALVAVKKVLQNEKIKNKLLLAFVADEETKKKGSTYLYEKRRELFQGIKYGIVMEPTSNQIRIGQKGICKIKVTFSGKAAHGARPEQGENAILKASEFICRLKTLSEELKKKKDPLLGSGTLSVGTIKGGTKVNVVPDKCEIEIDRRLIPGETPRSATEEVKKIAADGKVESTVGRDVYKVSEDSEIVRLLKPITKTKLVAMPGYTEAEYYNRVYKIPCVVMGPGISEVCHSTNEYINIKDLQEGTRIYEELIKKCCL